MRAYTHTSYISSRVELFSSNDSLTDSFTDATTKTENKMRRARVVDFAEGRRPTSGARKLEVWIEGLDAEIDVGELECHPAGYLLASESQGEGARAVDDGREDASAEIRCVCVVGLAHANGVVQRLAT